MTSDFWMAGPLESHFKSIHKEALLPCCMSNSFVLARLKPHSNLAMIAPQNWMAGYVPNKCQNSAPIHASCLRHSNEGIRSLNIHFFMWQTQCHLWRPLYFTMGWMVFSPSPVGSFMTEIALKQPPEWMKLNHGGSGRMSDQMSNCLGVSHFEGFKPFTTRFFPSGWLQTRLPADHLQANHVAISSMWYGHPSHRWNPNIIGPTKTMKMGWLIIFKK